MQRILLFVIVTLIAGNAWGQFNIREVSDFLKDKQELTEMSEKVTKLFSKGKTKKAFSEMTDYWPVDQETIDGLAVKTAKMMSYITIEHGSSIGIHKGKEKRIGDWALAQTYLIRYPYTAIKLEFYYVRNEKGWVINTFKWNDKWQEELE